MNSKFLRKLKNLNENAQAHGKKTCSLNLTPHICHHFVSLINMAAVLGPENLPNLTSDLWKVCTRHTIKYVHPTYESCASDLKLCSSDLQKLCFRPKKCEHPTYKKCVSDLRKLCIRPTNLCATGTVILMVELSSIID